MTIFFGILHAKRDTKNNSYNEPPVMEIDPYRRVNQSSIPSISCIIEYDPAIESESNNIHMAGSVHADRNG